ncbi:hypothetical protein [Microbacterium sp. B24]|uniref:hypothetical protein n=1 Tax=Microbacterium sp. B24 TaxID=95616 RepID=UPI0004167B7C|nr:hypothetical protein [Microbacterium sp. B24]
MTFTSIRQATDATAGDIVRATKGETVIVGEVEEARRDYRTVSVAGLDVRLNTLFGEGFTVEVKRQEPPLPTKPGYYEAADRYPMGRRPMKHPYLLAEDGKWYASYSGGTQFKPESVEHIRSLGRLVLLGSKA